MIGTTLLVASAATIAMEFLTSVEASTMLEVGVCPNVTSVANLDLQKLSGDWFHILHFPSEDEPFASCTHTTYTYKDGYLELITKGRDPSGKSITRDGVLGKLLDSETEALQLDVDRMPPLSVWVTYTDYTSVACLYSCTQFPGLRADWAWAITRSPRPLVKTVSRCRTNLSKLGVNTAKFERVPQRASCHKKRNKS
ncbi:apolipoprotein D-like [Macrobrachium rosenbergii]|uniref:apolipoprotein D-like n=1 Tax=Macrobrachium rosenbergii TaxID=79674 RepID=UPI0034D79E85